MNVQLIFVTGDGESGTDQSMRVKNAQFVYPRAFVGKPDY